jgi:hypothetical protein
MNQRARNAALKRLEAFIGEWRVTSSFLDAPPGRSVFEWALGSQYLVQRSEAPDPIPQSLAIISVDPKTGAYTQHYFDSRGVVRLYAMSFQRGTWTLSRGAPDFSPLDFQQRFAAKFAKDGSSINGAWEMSTDGGTTWKHDFDLTLTKQPPGKPARRPSRQRR